MAERTLANEKIFPVWNSTIAAYKTDDKGELEAVMLKNLVTGEETELAVKCVFMAIGHTPNTSFLGDLVDRDQSGYIVREPGLMTTKTPGLFAAATWRTPTTARPFPPPAWAAPPPLRRNATCWACKGIIFRKGPGSRGNSGPSPSREETDHAPLQHF